MVGDYRKHLENFEKFHFHPQKLFLLKISGNSQHQNVSTRNKPQHQTVSTRNKRQHQMASTRNKPQHQNASNRKKSYFVLLSSSVGFDRYGHTNTDTNIVIPTYTKPIPILASRIHTDTDTDIWFGIQIIPIPIKGINRYHNDICIPI